METMTLSSRIERKSGKKKLAKHDQSQSEKGMIGTEAGECSQKRNCLEVSHLVGFGDEVMGPPECFLQDQVPFIHDRKARVLGSTLVGQQ